MDSLATKSIVGSARLGNFAFCSCVAEHSEKVRSRLLPFVLVNDPEHS